LIIVANRRLSELRQGGGGGQIDAVLPGVLDGLLQDLVLGLPVTFCSADDTASAHLKLLVNHLRTEPDGFALANAAICTITDRAGRTRRDAGDRAGNGAALAQKCNAGAVFGDDAARYRGLAEARRVLTEVHVFWLAGMSCDGCSIAVTGATAPSVEELLGGTIPGLPKVVLHHPVLSINAGAEFVRPLRDAAEGTLGAPYVVVLEGSVPDAQALPEDEGYYSAMGAGGFDPSSEGDQPTGSPIGSSASVPAPPHRLRSAPARPGVGSGGRR
jgi:hypothetical protein